MLCRVLVGEAFTGNVWACHLCVLVYFHWGVGHKHLDWRKKLWKKQVVRKEEKEGCEKRKIVRRHTHTPTHIHTHTHPHTHIPTHTNGCAPQINNTLKKKKRDSKGSSALDMISQPVHLFPVQWPAPNPQLLLHIAQQPFFLSVILSLQMRCSNLTPIK